MQSTSGKCDGESKAHLTAPFFFFFFFFPSWEPSGCQRQRWKAQCLRLGARQSLNYRGWLL